MPDLARERCRESGLPDVLVQHETYLADSRKILANPAREQALPVLLQPYSISLPRARSHREDLDLQLCNTRCR